MTARCGRSQSPFSDGAGTDKNVCATGPSNPAGISHLFRLRQSCCHQDSVVSEYRNHGHPPADRNDDHPSVPGCRALRKRGQTPAEAVSVSDDGTVRPESVPLFLKVRAQTRMSVPPVHRTRRESVTFFGFGNRAAIKIPWFRQTETTVTRFGRRGPSDALPSSSARLAGRRSA